MLGVTYISLLLETTKEISFQDSSTIHSKMMLQKFISLHLEYFDAILIP